MPGGALGQGRGSTAYRRRNSRPSSRTDAPPGRSPPAGRWAVVTLRHPQAARGRGVGPARRVVFEDPPAGLRVGRAAGMATVALATPHDRSEPVADIVVNDLPAVSAQAADGGVVIVVVD